MIALENALMLITINLIILAWLFGFYVGRLTALREELKWHRKCIENFEGLRDECKQSETKRAS